MLSGSATLLFLFCDDVLAEGVEALAAPDTAAEDTPAEGVGMGVEEVVVTANKSGL